VVSLIISNGILSSVTHYFLQFNSVLIIIDVVLVLVLGLEGQVLVNITVNTRPITTTTTSLLLLLLHAAACRPKER